MSRAIDLDAYFQRIGYTGPRAPTLEVLTDIHFRHPQAIPFENLDPLLQRPVSLQLEALERKLLRDGRGGWCYEHNLLLMEVLRGLGFQVTGLAARVLWNAPESSVRARSHMLLRVDDIANEAYIADVGFGGLTLTAPLHLVTGVEQTTPHEACRLLEDRGTFILQVLVRSAWKPLYRFDLQPQVLPDYEVWNWYLANHPESPFVCDLLAARVTPTHRYGLLNKALSIHHLHGQSEQVTLSSPDEMRETLGRTFGIQLPDDPGVDSLLGRLTR